MIELLKAPKSIYSCCKYKRHIIVTNDRCKNKEEIMKNKKCKRFAIILELNETRDFHHVIRRKVRPTILERKIFILHGQSITNTKNIMIGKKKSCVQARLKKRKLTLKKYT